ncbi:hypothetical protein BCV70DRAFT_39368 [Testicularia cyperi]|uniref:Peptidase S54 rhomboid domain-containing protein n=1 Tax=Testicularia cyperi TaxID=1882483 RepID=A0A317XJM3_9BASI|nr:hypothetical protein BCV70DRAFT_39368 [Testicularia cyperi]
MAVATVAGFANAPVTKGLLIVVAICSVTVALFQLKPYAHLQLNPHIAVDGQYYRVLVQHFAFVNSSELLLALFLLYHAGAQVERTFGSHKFASFLLITTLLYTALQFVGLVALAWIYSRTPNAGASKPSTPIQLSPRLACPAGPWAPTFAILYQYARVIPDRWTIQLQSLHIGDRTIRIFVPAALLFFSQPTCSPWVSMLAVLVSVIYSSRSSLSSYRIPNRLYRLLGMLLSPWIGQTRLPTRSWRAEPPIRRTLANRETRLAENRDAMRTRTRG